ncbi:MAG: hypothetical protein IKE94_13985 [Aeriscardovia sp.]|nr:hypothetical protein [Aeriscardovia sp.]MBR3360548.1 hypothetical protein [Lachnospiraceae bacterium]MBR7076425.1 hypothetical protein [Lachnospiraceae bacterium]
MKYTKEERLDIGRRIYTQEITYKEAMELYGLSESCAHKYLTDYKRANGIPVMSQTFTNKNAPANASQVSDLDIETYMSMSKEELINELIKAKANELRAKKGYEVKGDGADREYISLNNKNSKS